MKYLNFFSSHGSMIMKCYCVHFCSILMSDLQYSARKKLVVGGHYVTVFLIYSLPLGLSLCKKQHMKMWASWSVHVIAAIIFAIWCKDCVSCDFLLILHASFHIKRPCFKWLLWLLFPHIFIISSTKHCFSYALGWLLSYLHAESLNHYANVQDINYLIAPENYAGNKFIHKMLSKFSFFSGNVPQLQKLSFPDFGP